MVCLLAVLEIRAADFVAAGSVALTGGAAGVSGSGGSLPPAGDDHGNTPTAATVVTLNTAIAGRIDAAGDIDCFRLVVPSSGLLTVRTTGATDTVGQLLDAHGSFLTANDDGNDVNFCLSRPVAAGTYHLTVEHFQKSGTGEYTLQVNFSGPAAGTIGMAGGRLVNLSVRAAAGAGEQALVVGCTINGVSAKPLLVRAIGPALAAFNVRDPLTDPQLQVHAGPTWFAGNDDWGQARNAAALKQTYLRLGAFGLPDDSRDAAVLDDMPPGRWTMQVTGGTAGGIALAEIYDADPNPATATSRVVTFVARAMVGSDDTALVAGFVVAGGARKVLVRAIGPTLRTFDLANVLGDPVLRLYRGNDLIAENDNVEDSPVRAQIESAVLRVGAFSLESELDSALLVNLPPGSYTAHVTGRHGTTGMGLVEIHEVP